MSSHPCSPSRFLLFSLILFIAVAGSIAAHEPPSSPVRRTAIVTAVEKTKLSVANIHSERNTQAPFGERGVGGSGVTGRSNGMGTGIIIDPRGYIVTNFHVVDEVTSLHVHLHNDPKKYEAEVIVKDKESDLAVIKIDVGRPLPVAKIGTSSDLMVGETVIAIGNAFGYEHTVSMGIVSALGRDVTLNKEVSYKQLIQTNASINPGNSGGPLLNIEGELIGVNVAIRAGAQGISFAIPVDSMLETVSDLLARRRRATLPTGLQYRDHYDNTQTQNRSLIIEKVVPDSICDKAGLKAGDILLAVNQHPITSGLDFECALIEVKPGEKFDFKYRRGSDEKHLQVSFETKISDPNSDLLWKVLGMKVMPTDNESITRLYAHLHGGMVITDLQTNGPAFRAGIQTGDILVGLQNWETCSYDNINYVLNHESFSTFKPLQFHIIRKGQLHRGNFPRD